MNPHFAACRLYFPATEPLRKLEMPYGIRRKFDLDPNKWTPM